MSRRPLYVLKFGSSVLRSERDLPVVVGEIAAHVGTGRDVVAVVSAVGGVTDRLLRRARELGSVPPPGLTDSTGPTALEAPRDDEAALAALLATGETTAAALVGLALAAADIPFSILDPGRVGPFTRGPRLDAEPHSLDARAIRRALRGHPVAVIPGFVGRDDQGQFTLLGRGGSDLSALFLAHTLGADRCRLLKDVGAVYEFNPEASGSPPRRFAALSWRDALDVSDRVMQRKAIQFAHRYRLGFEVGSCGDRIGTRVGKETSRFAPRRVGTGKTVMKVCRGKAVPEVRRASPGAGGQEAGRRVASCG